MKPVTYDPIIAANTSVTVSFHPSNFNEIVISTGDKIGVEVIKASMLPIAAPLLKSPIPKGIVPHEQRGKTQPTPTDLKSADGVLPPKWF